MPPKLFGGQLKVYRLRFTGPEDQRFQWILRFEQARRRTTVVLNGRRLGVNVDPYTPFQLEAKGLKRGEVNELLVYVDSRKDPRLPEGWWNWGGITRPVSLVPKGRLTLQRPRPALRRHLPRPRHRLPGEPPSSTACFAPAEQKPRFKTINSRGASAGGCACPFSQPRLTVRLRSPPGRITRKTFALAARAGAAAASCWSMRVPAPKLWSPDRPQLYDARVALSISARTSSPSASASASAR